jgi:hypothetical protein
LLILAAAPAPGQIFRDVAESWGVRFRHHHGGSGTRYTVETMCGGLATFDYDRDGDLDLFFVDGGELPGYEGEPARSRLLRNDEGSFTDVTESSGIMVTTYGMGVATGDADGDGNVDLYVTAFGPNQLFLNRGDGTFEDATAASGLADPLWSASAAFADTDGDGDLDLYVANYLDFEIAKHRECRDANNGVPIYCPPKTYAGAEDRFYRNRGDGTFDEVSAAVGLIPMENMAGLGVIFGDVDRNGWVDIYVANDEEPNLLFLNLGDGVFEDQGLLSGTAVSERGQVEAGMGVDLGDVDGDGLQDIVVTNFEKESNGLYRNLGGGLFVDNRYPSNVAESSLLMLAFGVALIDIDHDGDLDLVIGNGHVRDNAEQFGASRYAQRNQVLLNDGGGRFSEAAEVGFETIRVTRGLAYGDLDNDGDMDVVTVSSNDWAEAQENVAGSEAGGWLQVDLAGRGGNPRALGAAAELEAGGKKQTREVRAAASYLSQNTTTLHFGLGDETVVDRLDLTWPDGHHQSFTRLPVRRRLVVGGAR